MSNVAFLFHYYTGTANKKTSLFFYTTFTSRKHWTLITFMKITRILSQFTRGKCYSYIGKMNFKFSTKLVNRHPYQHVPEEYKAYCSKEPEKRAYKARILKNVLLRKSRFKFLEDIKMKKIHISALPAPIWLWDVRSIHVRILQSSSESVEQNANFEKIYFEKIMFYVSGGYKDKKNYISALPTPIWLKFYYETPKVCRH